LAQIARQGLPNSSEFHSAASHAERYKKGAWLAPARRAAWNNDLQGVCLKSGVNRASPGRPSVEPALARLAEGPSVQLMVNGAHFPVMPR
jgi:hypothetical protein